MKCNSMLETVGNTPLVKISPRTNDGCAAVYAKVEAFNPAGSAKDRVALAMLDDAEARGELAAGGTVIEPTSGNTGVGLAMACAIRGYRMILVMPDTMSVERIRLARAYGAEVVLTEGRLGMSGSVARAEELKRTIPGSIIAGQFVNPANASAHERTTGPEIWRDLEGKLDAFVAGVGTGGTLTGVARYLKAKGSAAKVVAVEPADSPLLSAGKAGPHGLQGIGANFVPEVLEVKLIDEIIPVTTGEAYGVARRLAANEGIFCGISSGAAMHAALVLARREEYRGRTIVALLPDTGERYLSTDLFNDKQQ